MKKIISVLLALVMTLALSVTALAAGETGTITVDNPKAGGTYTAYKIFDVSYNADKSAYSYTIQSDSEWFATVNTYATETNGLTLTRVTGTDTYVVTTSDKFSAPAFAVALKAALAGKTGTTLTVENGKATATGLELGYYFVSSTTGALCNLTTTNPTVTIHDKNDIPFDKVDNKESVDVGETVTYTITGKVPDYTGFTTYTYLITDEMSTGLTFDGVGTVKVTVGGTDVTTACTIAVDKDNSNKFTVSIPVMSYTIGAEIKVTYTATVNENAVAKVENNKATLTYSNNPTDSSKTTTTPEDKETVYSAKIVIDKYAANTENEEDHSKKLAGAQFVLYKMGEDGTTKQYYKWNDTKKVEWVADKKGATVKTTNENGAASFDGLADGTYYLEEIAAPAGYNLLNDPVKVVVDGAKAIAAEADKSVLAPVVAIANNTGTELPSTGGMGTTIFYVLGGALMAGAFVMLVVRKRMRTE